MEIGVVKNRHIFSKKSITWNEDGDYYIKRRNKSCHQFNQAQDQVV